MNRTRAVRFSQREFASEQHCSANQTINPPLLRNVTKLVPSLNEVKDCSDVPREVRQRPG